MKQISRTTSKMGALIAELLHGATKTHMTHLKTTSFSAHMALNDFYDELPDLVDSVAEQYQGVTEKLLDYPRIEVVPITTPENAIEYLRKLHTAITNYQKECMYSEIINELDVIKSLIDKTKYKLIFLG
jgi:DNA-binding ferritin-like protein